MSLLDRIYDIGGRLWIVQVASTPEPSMPKKISTKSYTLAQLMSEIANRDIQALAALPAELSIPFGEIFDAAGVIRHNHGWDVERLHGLLDDEPYSALAGDDLSQAVLECFGKDSASTEDLVKDAVGRDQAIDAFEEFARDKMNVRADARRRRLVELRAEIAGLEDEARRLEDETVTDRQQWRAWHLKKTDYEKMMARALSCLLDTPIVTLDPDDE